MSKTFSPTASQTKAINERGHEIVVSAAAGSGKTTVLINRIIDMVIKGECSVDEFLIVTFTRAATAEIRSRLATAITEALKKNPKDQNLTKQQMLVPSANIFTIDAFCANIVRANFESANVPPDFKVLQGGVEKALKKEALTETMAYFYEENSEAFSVLTDVLSYNMGDSVEDYVDKIYTKIQAYKNPDEMLDHSIDLYRPGTKTVDIAVDNFLSYADYLIKGLEKEMAFFSTEKNLIDLVAPDLINFKELVEHIKKREFEDAFNMEYDAKGFYVDFTGKEDIEGLNIKYYRDEMNKFFKEDKKIKNAELKKYFGYGDKYLNDDLKVQLPALEKLLEIVRLYSEKYTEKKEERNCLDFSDIEHIAYNLLVDANGDKTALAVSLSSSYKQILIDEYQDTNELQDAIFVALSDNSQNLFIVGDVKQSIYGFRNAMPELFIEKKTHPGGITLGENFRSYAGVIDYVNFIFDQVMTKKCGDIDYQDPTERLVHGRDDTADPHRVDVELYLMEGTKKKDLIIETNHIIEYIRTAMSENPELTYGDFAILMRTVKNRGNKVAKLLEDANIPVIFDGGSDFLSTADVKVMVSLLHVLDNPLLDVHMLAALMSPVFGFTPDDISQLRILSSKKGSLYANLSTYQAKNPKFKEALDIIQRYRQLSITMPVGELIRLIYDETLYPDIAASMPNGLQRQANLLLLRDYADEYEFNNEVGIGSFVRYLDDLIENEISPDSASLISGSTNAVKLMTIHKSKGLEFKYCFIMDLAYNFRQDSHNLIIGDKLQLGFKACDKDTHDIYPSFVYSQVKNANIYKDMAENLRILYVGMTRAKEKLILIGTLGKPTRSEPTTKKIQKLVMPSDIDVTTMTIKPESIANASNFLQIILMATIRHPFAPVLDTMVHSKKIRVDMPIKCNIVAGIEEPEAKTVAALSTNIDNTMLNEIKQRLDYEYPYEPLAHIPTKRSASSTESLGFKDIYFAKAVPVFTKESKLTAAQKGTCLHRFMQFADFEKAKVDAKAELERLTDIGYFTEIEANSINLEKVTNFFNSDFYKRIESSATVMREKKFAVLIPAKAFSSTLPAALENETVLIQGIADCVFEENGEYVILDYKTDRTTDKNQLVETYKDQLLTYKLALSDILDKPVTKAYLYSFSCEEEIEISFD